MAIMLQYIQYWMDQKQTFKPGDECVQVAWMSGVLQDYGIHPEGPLTFVYNDYLVEGIKAFQKSNKREETGIADVSTMRDLQRQWVIHGLRDYGLSHELDGTAPKGFYEDGSLDSTTY